MTPKTEKEEKTFFALVGGSSFPVRVNKSILSICASERIGSSFHASEYLAGFPQCFSDSMDDVASRPHNKVPLIGSLKRHQERTTFPSTIGEADCSVHLHGGSGLTGCSVSRRNNAPSFSRSAHDRKCHRGRAHDGDGDTDMEVNAMLIVKELTAWR